MKRTPNLLVLVLMMSPFAFAGPNRVTTRVIDPGPYFVGQAIELQVQVEGDPGLSKIEAPRSNLAEIRPLPLNQDRPSLARFLVILKRAGLLELPPFRAKTDVSKPIRLTIANVPAEGRTSTFLGGVGTFAIEAEAGPPKVRPGQALEYRLKISGLAAWGSVRAPDLGEWSSLTPAFRVETLPDVFEEKEPFSRTFRYQLRPMKPGRISLPPVSIAAFDPKTRRYATRASASVPIWVEEPPRFDPKTLSYEPNPKPSNDFRPGLWTVGLSLFVFLFSSLGLWFLSRRERDRERPDPKALALELSRELGAVTDDDFESARAITDALTTFLHKADGRTPGVLTPPEARSGFERLTEDRDLAIAAEDLVRRCDQVRYGRNGQVERGRIEQAREFFERVAETLARK